MMDTMDRRWMRLRIPEIEKTFNHVVIDLNEILVFDGIDLLPNLPGFRIRSHDLFGVLPDVIIEDTENRLDVLENVRTETAKLYAMVRVRTDLAGIFPGCKFLLPTSTDEGSLVGMRFQGKTVLTEAPSHWEAYHRLARKAVRKIL